MNPVEHYDAAKAQALAMRQKYGLSTSRVMVNDLKRICKAEGIDRVEYYEGFSSNRVKGAYFNDFAGSTVMVNKRIMTQIEPKVFTIGHELKHHLMDNVQAVSLCSDDNENGVVEKAADIFAGELVFPTDMFVEEMTQRQIGRGRCTAEDIVRLKHETSTTLSHLAILVRASYLGYVAPKSLDGVQWNNLRDRMYPEYAIFRRSH